MSGFGCHGLFPGNAENAGFGLVEDVVRIATSSKEVEAVIDAAVKVGVVRADTSKAKKLRIWYGFFSVRWMRGIKKKITVCVGGFVVDTGCDVVVKDGKYEVEEGN